MSPTIAPLVLDLVEWVGLAPRPYAEVMDAWRTSCPRLTVWEDAVDRGFVERRPDPAGGCLVVVTAAGKDFLAAHGRLERAPLARPLVATRRAA